MDECVCDMTISPNVTTGGCKHQRLRMRGGVLIRGVIPFPPPERARLFRTISIDNSSTSTRKKMVVSVGISYFLVAEQGVRNGHYRLTSYSRKMKSTRFYSSAGTEEFPPDLHFPWFSPSENMTWQRKTVNDKSPRAAAVPLRPSIKS